MNRKLKLWELNRVDATTYHKQRKFPIILILDDIRSLSNIGTFFRTADSFNIEKIYLCGITAKPPHREIHKTALGATETVQWEYADSIESVILKLKSEHVAICTVEQTEKTIFLQDIDQLPGQKFALIFGNEVDGVNQNAIDLSDYVIEIPQFGTKHSLNVSVCAGVVVWEFAKRYFDA